MSETSNNFLKIKNENDLAVFLGVKPAVIRYYTSYETPYNAYHSFVISKKNGQNRMILAPNKQLLFIQKSISAALYDIYVPRRSAHGFIRKRSIITNAAVHTDKRLVLNLDLKNFFESIHFGRVLGLFQKDPFNFSYRIAVMLTRLVCYKKMLPTGAPTSPIISNLICRKLDKELYSLSKKNKIIYTRYCDDITFSTRAQQFPASICYYDERGRIIIGNDLKETIRANTFEINPEKTRLQSKKSRQMVTGLIVNKHVNIPKTKYRHFRAMVFYCSKEGLEKGAIKNGFVDGNNHPLKEKFIQHLRGNLNYYRMVLGVNHDRYRWLANKCNLFLPGFYYEDSKKSVLDDLINDHLFVIEGNESQGTAFYVNGVGLITCLHVISKKDISEKELNDELKNYCAFQPMQSKVLFELSLKAYSYKDDLIILSIVGVGHKGGFSLASSTVRYDLGEDDYTAISYPNYAEKKSGEQRLFGIKVTQERIENDLNLKIIDKALYYGSSGGPILNKEYEVVGYIEKGNGFGEKDEKNYNAFCPVSAIYNLISKIKI